MCDANEERAITLTWMNREGPYQENNDGRIDGWFAADEVGELAVEGGKGRCSE